MNAAELFSLKQALYPHKIAIATIDDTLTFRELARRAGSVQQQLTRMSLRSGDKALLMAHANTDLYATALALMGLGVSIIFVEPWMPLSHIEKVVKLTSPKLYVANFLGMLWGARVKAIRSIKTWTSLSSLKKNAEHAFFIEDVPGDLPGIITFTTGTTGDPKGVVRSHGYLINQHRILQKSLHLKEDQECDLTIFANFVFSNLARGCSSLLMPTKWSKRNFTIVNHKAQTLKPSTTTCGPAFLKEAMRSFNISSLQHFHVGGALTDCAIFEQAFLKWPHAEILHVYGSSEAEPVACVDATRAVKESKDAGYFQTLFLGRGVEDAKLSFTDNSLWVSGAHVCPKYVGSDEENKLFKRLDRNGVLWHDMGDRIIMDDRGLWYRGRSSQKNQDFLLEQRLYAAHQSSKSFIRRNSRNEIMWLGEDISRMKLIAASFKEIGHVVKTCIVRDKRHRARIDRLMSTPKNLRA